jgi:hypothetical protein
MPPEGLCDWPRGFEKSIGSFEHSSSIEASSARESAGLAKGIFFGIIGLNWMAGCLAEVYAGPLVAPFGFVGVSNT